jgi:hypothetical protein
MKRINRKSPETQRKELILPLPGMGAGMVLKSAGLKTSETAGSNACATLTGRACEKRRWRMFEDIKINLPHS